MVRSQFQFTIWELMQVVVVEHLGQAVFPLLRFFESINSDLSG